MSNLSTLPDLSKSLQIMKIIDELPLKADHNTLIGAVIINACLTKQPAKEIIQMIKDQATDNYKAMVNVIGRTLTNEILNL